MLVTKNLSSPLFSSFFRLALAPVVRGERPAPPHHRGSRRLGRKKRRAIGSTAPSARCDDDVQPETGPPLLALPLVTFTPNRVLRTGRKKKKL